MFIYLFVIYLLCPSKSVMELGIGDKISDSLFSFRPLTLLKCSQWKLVTFAFISQASSLLNCHAYHMFKKSRATALELGVQSIVTLSNYKFKNYGVNRNIYSMSPHPQYDVTNHANIYCALSDRYCANYTEFIKSIKPNIIHRYCY